MDASQVYADIRCSEDSLSRRRANSVVVQQAVHRKCPHWHWIALWLSCTGNVILMVTVILMWFHGLGCNSSTVTNRSSQNPKEITGISNAHQCNQDENKTNSQLGVLRTYLRQHLCEATDATTENGYCSVCPVTWVSYEGKCYWFSTSILSWIQSRKDCETKRARLLVISSTGEQEFIQDITKNKSTWIGLRFKLSEEKWMWINGSPLNQTQSQRLMANCGIIGKKGIASDMCSTELYWICQKPSIFI